MTIDYRNIASVYSYKYLLITPVTGENRGQRVPALVVYVGTWYVVFEISRIQAIFFD